MAAATKDGIEALKNKFRRLDAKGDGSINRGVLSSVLTSLGLEKGTVAVILDSTSTNEDGSSDINKFFDWLYATPRDHLDTDELVGPTSAAVEGPLFVSTLNFLGNAYNPMEFMNNDEGFTSNYAKIREAFKTITKEQVMKEVVDLGFQAEAVSEMLLEERFEDNCSKAFLRDDNKVDARLRTNMIVAGMMPTDRGPLFEDVSGWRELMASQKENYAKYTELVAWDIACNLVAEGVKPEYIALCRESYLNPNFIVNLLTILLDRLPVTAPEDTREVVCAVQEFPEDGSAKHRMLLNMLTRRGLRHVMAEGINSSVAFIVNAGLELEGWTQSPLGVKVDEVLAKMRELEGVCGKELRPVEEPVSDNDVKSLSTTARKTIVLDVAKTAHRPAVRFLSAHAKEFKTDEGTRLLARYLRACVGSVQERAAAVMLDSNTPDAHASSVFDAACRECGFDVRSPAGKYRTTRKQRSEMHGQIYNEKKCLKVVEAHKTFMLFIQQPSESPAWETNDIAGIWPDLNIDTQQTLPNRLWPTDHCMLHFDLTCKA